MSAHKLLICTLTVFGALAPQAAQAEFCDYFELEEGAQRVVLGSFGAIGGLGTSFSTGHLGVCWQDAGGSWHLEETECTNAHLEGDYFRLYANAEDNYVGTMLPGQAQDYGLGGDPDFVRAGGSHGGLPQYGWQCQGAGDIALNAWDPGFQFGVWVDMGEGADTFYGSPNMDRVASNYANFSQSWVWGSGWQSVEDAPGDGARDTLCGGDGDDFLYGDRDDDYTISQEERLDGGNGIDHCDGDPFFYIGNSVSDVAKSTCEDREDAWFSDSASFFSCDGFENPLDVIYSSE